MAIPFEPEEVDTLDESLLGGMNREELRGFRDRLLVTLDDLESAEPDMDEEEDEYYEWEDRINVLQDLIDAIDGQLGEYE